MTLRIIIWETSQEVTHPNISPQRLHITMKC